MAPVLNKPQFQVFTHSSTGEKTGRIYFPALFLAEFYRVVIKWLESSDLNFDSRDIKTYEDGSFRLYFQANNAPETLYFRLIKITEQYFNSAQISPDGQKIMKCTMSCSINSISNQGEIFDAIKAPKLSVR